MIPLGKHDLPTNRANQVSIHGTGTYDICPETCLY